MSATGTIPQLHQATSIPVRTLQRWAQQGLLTRVGNDDPPRYSIQQARQIKAGRGHAAGTVAQLHKTTGIPTRTIYLYIQQNALVRVDRILVGKRYVPRYDGEELMDIDAERAETRRNNARGKASVRALAGV